ncbi:MAG: valine--tRNA ligase [Chloroflexota bacterium]|nr:valine--tRNA ligase [Chloroflexota bacterium]
MTTTTNRELAPRYDAAAVEPGIYRRWLESGAFTPSASPPSGGRRFVVIQPPPNVTGALHIGHALVAAIQDTFVRYHRMRGDDTLWLPGVDHASIAAQFVLDKIIAEEGESRQSLGRDRYLERMWRFMEETRSYIGSQHQRLGVSVDWSRERFTMDDMSARAVRAAFKRLWDAGLAYRGEALVNWCPRCQTTISDLENVHREEMGTLWTIRYHLARPHGTPDAEAWIPIATTRPETLLGDVAVAVHPEDERYAALVGREAVLPFLGRRLPIIADEMVERGFGTGAVKITPAHDPDDYEFGKRHGLPAINVLDDEARINANGGEFAGLDRCAARRAIVERLTAAGDVERAEPHQMVVGHCQRCDTVVEPRLSTQWFINVKPLAERALASVRERRTRIVPDRFEKVYAHWMENIHDWAVGRQLWWGHRIPAWYCPDGHISVSENLDGPDACAECGRPAAELTQESDIFDTWFSAALWPFSTLGWPEATPDLARFYPTTLMETGYDILFFWVARMMMMGLFCTDTEPFEVVYLHGLVRAEGGVKMSKTKGNVLDPIELIDEIGADALRYALVAGTSPGADQQLTRAKLDGARNFTNKLWNAARFVLSARPEPMSAPSGEPSLAERWIRSRQAEVIERITRHLDELDLGGYTAAAYDYAWSDVCDWYLEMAKVELRREGANNGDRSRVWHASIDVLANLLRLLHPIMPFLTEAVWSAVREAAPEVAGDDLLLTAAWPFPGDRDPRAEAEFTAISELIRTVRNARTEAGLPAGAWQPLELATANGEAGEAAEANTGYVTALARVRPFTIHAPGTASAPDSAVATPLGAAWLAGPMVGEAAARRAAQVAQLEEGIGRLRTLLDNPEFTAKAPPRIVGRERARLAELEEQLRQIGA